MAAQAPKGGGRWAEFTKPNVYREVILHGLVACWASLRSAPTYISIVGRNEEPWWDQKMAHPGLYYLWLIFMMSLFTLDDLKGEE